MILALEVLPIIRAVGTVVVNFEGILALENTIVIHPTREVGSILEIDLVPLILIVVIIFSLLFVEWSCFLRNGNSIGLGRGGSVSTIGGLIVDLDIFIIVFNSENFDTVKARTCWLERWQSTLSTHGVEANITRVEGHVRVLVSARLGEHNVA